MKANTVVLISLLALSPMAAQAQKIFVCKDASGKTLTSDRPIPECADRTVREMDRNGMVRREIPPPLTAEQKRAKQAEEEKRKAEELAAAEQKQADRALLARYRNEKDIDTAHNRSLEIVQEQLKRERAALAAKAEPAPVKNGKNVTPAMARKAEEAEQAAEASRKRIQELEAESAQMNEKYAATVKRYRELTAGAASPAGAATLTRTSVGAK